MRNVTMALAALTVCLASQAAQAAEECRDANDKVLSRGATCTCPQGMTKKRSELQPFQSVNRPLVPTIYECVGGASARPKPPTKDCHPKARAESKDEKLTPSMPSTYQVVVADNDCANGVSFEYSIETKGVGTKNYWTQCVPASRTGFVATGARTSSTKSQSMTVSNQYRDCKQ